MRKSLAQIISEIKATREQIEREIREELTPPIEQTLDNDLLQITIQSAFDVAVIEQQTTQKGK